MLTPLFFPFPQLVTERLILRRVREEDLDEIFILRSDPVTNRNSLRPLITKKEEAMEFIQKIEGLLNKNEGISWMICERERSDIVIGTIGLWRLIKEHYRGEIGYMLKHEFHGRGIMSEAMQAVILYGFNQLKLHSIEARISPGNKPSIAVVERNNFVKEGYFKEDFFANGQFYDSNLYSLINTEDKNWIRD